MPVSRDALSQRRNRRRGAQRIADSIDREARCQWQHRQRIRVHPTLAPIGSTQPIKNRSLTSIGLDTKGVQQPDNFGLRRCLLGVNRRCDRHHAPYGHDRPNVKTGSIFNASNARNRMCAICPHSNHVTLITRCMPLSEDFIRLQRSNSGALVGDLECSAGRLQSASS